MKRVLFIFMILCVIGAAYAKQCEVDGISDSPQKLSCEFPSYKLNLSCKGGTYYLNKTKVNVAYHLEVEEGSHPLVFKTRTMELTVVIDDSISAVLLRGKTETNGICKE